MSSKPTNDAPVIIVGAGPVGLSAAIDLAWRGVACVVVEIRAAAEPPVARVAGAGAEHRRRLQPVADRQLDPAAVAAVLGDVARDAGQVGAEAAERGHVAHHARYPQPRRDEPRVLDRLLARVADDLDQRRDVGERCRRRDPQRKQRPLARQRLQAADAET